MSDTPSTAVLDTLFTISDTPSTAVSDTPSSVSDTPSEADDRLMLAWHNGTIAEDAQGTPDQRHTSPSILKYTKTNDRRTHTLELTSGKELGR